MFFEFLKKRWRLFFVITVIASVWIITIACGNKATQKSGRALFIIESAPEGKKTVIDSPGSLSRVGFVSRRSEPDDKELNKMIDEAILQVLGPEGLSTIIKKGDKVLIKVNNVGPYFGRPGEKGRGVITDPRITRYIAEKVREIIGFEGSADIKVADALFSSEKNPSSKNNKASFHSTRLERGINGKDNVYYDEDCDGILDGSSKARLVNLDSYGLKERFLAQVKDNHNNYINVLMPLFMRTKEMARKSGLFTNEYCDVLIGLPLFKSHSIVGVTGALKLHYGFRPFQGLGEDTGRWSHSGLYFDKKGMHEKQNLLNYLSSQHKVREYDFVLMDCLVGNRRGPQNPDSAFLKIYEDQPVDFIYSHAILSSKDPVAIDTVETLMAGYDPASIGILETGSRYGLGNNNPGFILVEGLTNFMEHKRFLYNTYSPSGKYPFQDGWGEARVLKDKGLFYPENGNFRVITGIIQNKGMLYTIKYKLECSKRVEIKPVRVDLYINGTLFACKNSNPEATGEINADLGVYKSGNIRYRIIFWDNTLNCLVSNEKVLKL